MTEFPYLKHEPPRLRRLPEAVDYVHSNQLSDVWVKGVHDEVNVMEVVEIPAFRNERVAEYVMEREGSDVLCGRDISNPG